MAIKRSTQAWLWEKFTNLCLALFYFWFIYIFTTDFVITHRVSSLLMLVYNAVIAFFVLVRVMPREVTANPLEWLISLGGTLGPLFMRPAGEMNDGSVFIVVQAAGLLISLVGMLSLNRSFGILPANRGVKTLGMYGVVRHPLYAGYLLSTTGFFLQNFSVFNTIWWSFWLLCTYGRICIEEKFLSEDEAYVAYKQKVRWRVLPFVF